MKVYIYITILVNVVNILSGAPTDDVADYYWRAYSGDIPNDAFIGGQDQNENPIYIGQVPIEGNLIPGKIYQNDPNVYFPYNGAHKQTENVRILCSRNPEKFQWVPVKHEKMTGAQREVLKIVNGGYEGNYVVYIGRNEAGGETAVGKLLCDSLSCPLFYTIVNGEEIKYNGIIETLGYNH